MKLTPLQQKLLKSYHCSHSAPPTIGRFIRRNWAALALFAFLIVAGLYLAMSAWGLWFGVGCFAAGMGFGSLSRVLRQAACSVKIWPVVDQITDWSKVDSLLSEPPSS